MAASVGEGGEVFGGLEERDAVGDQVVDDVRRRGRRAGPSSRRRAGRRSQVPARPRGTRPICAQRTPSPLWWNSSPSRTASAPLGVERQVDDACPAGAAAAAPAASAAAWPRHWNTTSAPWSPGPCRQRLLRSATAPGRPAVERRRRPSASATRAPARGRVDDDDLAAPCSRANRAVSSPTTPAPVTSDAPAARRRRRGPRRPCRRRRGGVQQRRWRRSGPCARRRRRAAGRGRRAAARPARVTGSATWAVRWP